MKKIILSLSILLYVSAFSQTMTLINNTTELIEVTQLMTNDFCTYNFATSTFPQLDVASDPMTNKWIGPSSAAIVRDINSFGPWMFDFEFLQLDIIDIGPMTPVVSGARLGTSNNFWYMPASCDVPSPPFAMPVTPPCSMCVAFPPPSNPVIRQVVRPDLGFPADPDFIALAGSNGKIYRLTWFTSWNSATQKYDVEITVN